MAKSSVIENYIFNTGYQIFLLIVPLITMPYVSRILGSEAVGTYSYYESIAALFVMVAPFGTNSYGSREISYYQDSRKKRTKVFWNVFSLRLITGIIFSGVYFVISCNQNEQILSTILTLNIISITFDISWMLQGVEDFQIIALRNIVVKVISTALIFILINDSTDLILYAIVMCVSTLLGNISVIFVVGKYIDKPDLKKINPFHDFNVVLGLFIPTVALSISNMLDKPIIGLLSKGYNESGYYDRASKIVNVSLMVITSLGTVLKPRMGYWFENKEYKKIQQCLKKSFSFVFMLGLPLCMGLIGTASVLVPVYLGDGYEGAIRVLKTLSVTIPVIGISNIIGTQYLLPTKREKDYTKSIIFGACVNLIGDILLVKKYGALGVAAATVFAELTVSCYQILRVRKDIDIRTILHTAYKYLISSIIMYGVTSMICKMPIGNLPKLIIMILVGAAIYFSALFVMQDVFFREIVMKFKEKPVKWRK